MSLLPSAVILRRRLPLTCLVRSSLAPPQRRTMAGAGRNYYIKDGSNPTGITDEVRDLVKNQRTAYNIDEWRKQTGIGEAVRLDNQDDDDIDDDQIPDVAYYPHKGDDFEERSREYKPSPVLLVKRVRTLKGQPYYHKEMCERLGLGFYQHVDRMVVVPNTPSMLTRLYTIKHIIEIIPIKFPMGFPDDEEFDPAACRINLKGEFYYHPKLKEARNEVMTEPSAPMKITADQVKSEAIKHWFKPYNSPLGNSNYHRVNGTDNNPAHDHATDPTFKKKFS